jgi:PAS domain S-box-containing protein
MQEAVLPAAVPQTDHRKFLASAPELIELLPIGIYACDADGRVRWFNSKAADIWGRRPRIYDDTELFCGFHEASSFDGRPLERDETAVAQALRTGEPIHGKEATVERPDGSRITAIININLVRDERGEVIGAIKCFSDVSESKDQCRSAEAQQRILFSELNHRIKNNFQMLLAMLGTAKRGARHPETITILTEALQRVGAMAAAQQSLHRADHVESYDSREFMSALYANVAPSLGHGVRMECSATAGELQNATAMPLALIITELAINAAKHGASPGAAVEIKITLQRDADNFMLTVDDNGPGFELKTDRRSSGLNLVNGLAHQIGGTFEVTRNAGAHCTVKFPATTQAA